MITTLLPYSRYIKAIASLAVVAVLFGAGWKARGWLADAAIAEVQKAHADAVAVGATAAAKLHGEYRDLERQMQETINEVSQNVAQRLREKDQEHDAAVELVRADVGRLRAQFASCRAANVSSTTPDSSATAGSDDAGAGGLSPADVEPFLRIARDANRVAVKLEGCQMYAREVEQKLSAYALQLR